MLARSLQGGEREEFVDSSLFVFAKAKFSFYFPTVSVTIAAEYLYSEWWKILEENEPKGMCQTFWCPLAEGPVRKTQKGPWEVEKGVQKEM